MQIVKSLCHFNTRNQLVSMSVGLAVFAACGHRLNAATLFVPNGSFESPVTSFADPAMDAWQKSPQPFWFPPGTNTWDQVMGQFLNTPVGSPGHINNMDGRQAAYLFAVPDAAIMQDFNTFTGTNAPKHDFIAQYEAGKSYTLTVGVLGNGGGMQNGVQLQISLYFRDLSNNIVTVGATTITNSAALFPTNTYLTDFQVRLPIVRANDAWAGKRIGVRIASLADFGNQGGYWDVDNVRLTGVWCQIIRSSCRRTSSLIPRWMRGRSRRNRSGFRPERTRGIRSWENS
jgi:hypothetical protein